MKTKNIFVVVWIASGIMISCNNQTHNTNENNTDKTLATHVSQSSENENLAPVMTFKETEFDFGTAVEGDILKHSFSFTNTGNAPLIIVNAKGSCGCTVSDWPKEPIAPGATKEMLVTFNTNGKPNLQSKQVTITTNTTAEKQVLKIKAMVTPKKKGIANSISLNK